VKKNVTGRQLARVSHVESHETLWSELYAGNRHTIHCFQPAVEGTEKALELQAAQRKRTVWRMDGGSGSDAQLCWLLKRDYHVMAKGLSAMRAATLAKQVRRWDVWQDAWLAEVPPPIDYGRPVRVFVKRRIKKGKDCYSYYVSTLSLPAKGLFMTAYDQRGGAEIEQFRNDKSGLYLAARRKHGFLAQKAYILLTDLVHNLLSHFHFHALAGTKFDAFGPKRIVRDLFHIPGNLVFDGNQLIRIELLSLNQNAQDLLLCLQNYCFT